MPAVESPQVAVIRVVDDRKEVVAEPAQEGPGGGDGEGLGATERTAGAADDVDEGGGVGPEVLGPWDAFARRDDGERAIADGEVVASTELLVDRLGEAELAFGSGALGWEREVGDGAGGARGADAVVLQEGVEVIGAEGAAARPRGALASSHGGDDLRDGGRYRST